MILYAFGFAAFIFHVLPPKDAGPVIRQAFPHFYLFVLGTSVLAAGLAAPAKPMLGLVLALIAITVLFARQVLMPAINRASDTQDRAGSSSCTEPPSPSPSPISERRDGFWCSSAHNAINVIAAASA